MTLRCHLIQPTTFRIAFVDWERKACKKRLSCSRVDKFYPTFCTIAQTKTCSTSNLSCNKNGLTSLRETGKLLWNRIVSLSLRLNWQSCERHAIWRAIRSCYALWWRWFLLFLPSGIEDPTRTLDTEFPLKPYPCEIISKKFIYAVI